jgi:hypothetical protein
MMDTKRGTAQPRDGTGRPAGLARVPGGPGRVSPEGSTVREEL